MRRLLRSTGGWWLSLLLVWTCRSQAQPIPVVAPVATNDSSTSTPMPVAAAAATPAPSSPTGGSNNDSDNDDGSTFAPTVTWSPTSTPLPTITAFPTYTFCNVCGPDGSVTLPDETLALPSLAEQDQNVTCRDAQTAGYTGQVPQETCQFLQLFVFDNNLCGCANRANNITAPPTVAPTSAFPACNLCGDNNNNSSGATSTTNDDTEEFYYDYSILNPSATLLFGNATVHCSFAQDAGRNGLWNPELCLVLQNVSVPVCGCGPTRVMDDSDNNDNNDNNNDNTTDTAGTCYLCGGPEYEFIYPDAQIPVPFELTQALEGIVDDNEDDPFRCGTLERFQDVPAWSPLVCSFLQSTGAAVCGCRNVTIATTTPGTSPTQGMILSMAPTTETTTTTAPSNNNENGAAPPPIVSTSAAVRMLSWRNSDGLLWRRGVVTIFFSSSTALGLLLFALE